jgi:hypothetical protein
MAIFHLPPGLTGRRRAAAGAAVALAALAAASGARAAAPAPPLPAALLDGSATACAAEAPDDCSPLLPGEAPRTGSLVTSETGATLRVNGGALLRLEPRARARFVRSMLVPLRGGAPTQTQVVRVEAGTALATVPSAYVYKSAVLFQFSATRSALAKEGLTAVHAGDQGVGVGSVIGTQLITTDGRFFQVLRQGRGRRFAPGAADPVDFPLLAAPTVKPSSRLSIYQPGRPPPQVTWAPVEGAATYEVRLTQEGRPDPLRVVRAPAAQTSLAFDGLSVGTYEVTLHSIDADGVPGPPSDPSPLTVVNVSLPPGVSVGEGGQIRLGSHQRLTLAPIDRVQASLGFNGAFGPAPPELDVGPQGARLVRLRQAGDESSVELLLIRRTLRALVEVGPATAHWPSTPVQIAVRLVDELGRPFDPPPPVRPQIRLGVEPIEASWRQEGAVLTATVEPHALPGPAVLRVEVADDRGVVVGRNFLELVPESPAHHVAAASGAPPPPPHAAQARAPVAP